MKSRAYPILPLLRHCRLCCCLAVLLCLPGCRKKPVDVSGQVFIVNPKGTSEKLGLVGIHVLDDGEFKALAASVLDRLVEADRRAAQREADGSAIDAAEKWCRTLARRDYVIPGLDGLLYEVRARRLALGAPGCHPSFDDLLDRVIAALPAPVARSDADGRFSIPVDHKVWVVAAMPRKVGERVGGRLWVAPCEAGEPGKAGPLLLSNNCQVPGIRAFAGISGRGWRAMDADKMSATPGVATWVVATAARADELAAEAGLKRATAMAD